MEAVLPGCAQAWIGHIDAVGRSGGADGDGPLPVCVLQLREKYGTLKYVPTDLRFKKTRAIRRRLTKKEVRA